MTPMRKESVVITGAGLVCSLGSSAQETWEALLSGKQGIRRIEEFDAQGFGCRTAACVDNLSLSQLNIQQKAKRIMLKHSYLLLKCSQDALRHAQLNPSSIPGEEKGFIIGMGMVDYEACDLLPAVLKSRDSSGNFNYDSFYSRGYQEIFPLWPLSMLNNISLCQAVIDLDIKGENAVFSPHADSGIQAIGEAVNVLLEKKAKLVLAGGVSENICPNSLARASFFGLLSQAGLEADCRPFGAGRNGTILGEGCGILSLELRSTAEERKVSYCASITGWSSAFEAEGENAGPTARAVSLSMEKAITRAGLRPEDIDLVIAHGDGTYLGDRNEAEAIHRVFDGCLGRLKVYSSKGALGHTLAAAPAIDTILGVYILKHGLIPAAAGTVHSDENIRFHLVSNGPEETPVGRILINALGSEGHCGSLVLEAVNK